MFKSYNNLSPNIVNDIFEHNRATYNLRNRNFNRSRKVNSVYNGTESLSYLGPKIWDLVPIEIKQSENLNIFKKKIKTWTCSECPCRLCKTFVPELGFI